MSEEFKLLPQTPFTVGNTKVDDSINQIAPNEEYAPSTARQLAGMGIEIGGGILSELALPLNAIPFVGTAAYGGIKYSMGVGSSYLAQYVEGQPEWRHGRAQFAGGANVVPFGSTVRKTKDGVNLVSKVMAGKVAKTALKGSTIATASITGERVIDDGRLPTLKELGFAATAGATLGAGMDIGLVKAGEKFLPVWDKMTDGMKSTFLKVSGKSPMEIRDQIAKGKITRDEFRVLRDQLVDDAYKDAGFFDGFMGNKKIDVNALKPEQRLDYVKNRVQYLEELQEDIVDNFDEGIIDTKQFKAQSKPIGDEIRALNLREGELTKLARETPQVKPETERPVSTDEVIDEVDEPDVSTPLEEPEVDTGTPAETPEVSATPKDAPEPQVYYHGSKTDFDTLLPDEEIKSKSFQMLGRGIYLTNQPKFARTFAGKDGFVKKIKIPEGKIADESKFNDIKKEVFVDPKFVGFNKEIEEVRRRLIDEGFIGTRASRDADTDIVVIFDSKNASIVDDIKNPTPPKDTPVANDKERILELTEELMAKKDILDADGEKIGLGDRVAVEKTEELTKLFTAYKTNVFKPLQAMINGEDYDADELIKLLDEYAEIAPAKFEVDNKDGGVLAIRREDRTADQFQKQISERKQAEVEAINNLRDMVKRNRDEPLDFDNLESLRKRVMGEVDDEIAEGTTPNTKPTPQERRTASLEKQLQREQEIFTGQRDPSNPKAPVTSPRIKEIEAKIKFYRTASKEAADIAELEEKNKLLLAMVSGQDVSKIDETLGIHPRLRPDYANKKKVKGHLAFLRKQNQRLQKEAREAQQDAAYDQAYRVLNPDYYAKSKLDAFVDKFEEITTGNLLASTLTGTAGLLSNTVAMLGRPIRDTIGGRLWKSLPLEEKRLYRQALYRLADVLSYKEVVTGFLDPSNIRNAFGAAINRGQNPMFPQARVRFDDVTRQPRLQNQRAIDRARKRQQRRDKGDGLNNTLVRIKTAETVGNTLMELVLFGRTMLGVMDVPFANAITKSRLQAEAIRDAIRNEAPDIQAHVKKYIDEAFEVQNGRKIWAYKERDMDIINEYREALGMPRDLKEGDIRKTISETIIEAVDKQTGAGTIFGRLVQIALPIRTTGTIFSGQILSKVATVPINASRLAHKGIVKMSPDSKLAESGIGKTGIVELERTKRNVSRYKQVLRDGVDDKGVKLTKEARAKINDQLVVEETRLAKLKVQMEEIDRKAIGNLAMFGALFIYYWNLADDEGITGSGAHLSRQQRKDSNFQPYKMLFDDGETMVDYRMADPDKGVVAFIADIKAFKEAEQKNQTLEGQTLSKTMRQSAYQILTDNPFMTGFRNVSVIADPEVEGNRLIQAIISIATSRFQPPSMFRHINQLDDVYVPDRSQSKPLTMAIDRMFGREPANVRRYETGAPMLLPEKNIWNLLSRSASVRKRRNSFQEVYDILEADGQRTNIVGGLSSTQDKIKTKEYWNDEQTLYDAFGEFIYTYSPNKPIEVGNKKYRNLTLEEAMYEIITDSGWNDKYKDGKIANVDTDDFMYSEDFMTI
jgi:hypothetical protein